MIKPSIATVRSAAQRSIPTAVIGITAMTKPYASTNHVRSLEDGVTSRFFSVVPAASSTTHLKNRAMLSTVQCPRTDHFFCAPMHRGIRSGDAARLCRFADGEAQRPAEGIVHARPGIREPRRFMFSASLPCACPHRRERRAMWSKSARYPDRYDSSAVVTGSCPDYFRLPLVVTCRWGRAARARFECG